MIKVSIVIPTFNRCESVKHVLTALTAQTYSDEDFEVIVSIDGSEDDTRRMVEQFDSPYTLRSIWEPNNGRAAACNRGIRAANGDVIILLDDDMEPSPRLVEAHYLAHSSASNFGIIGASPIVIDESSTLAARYIASEFNSRQEKMADIGYNFQIWDFYSGNFSIRRKIVLDAGGYNESFKRYGYEDIELAYRLIQSGVEFVYSPDAVCIQHYNESFKSLAMKTISSGRTTVTIVNLHPDLFCELKLREYNLTGWKWRSLRLMMIWVSILVPFTTSALIILINLSAKLIPSLQKKLYSLGLDYLFWLGVWSEMRTTNSKYLIPKIKTWKLLR